MTLREEIRKQAEDVRDYCSTSSMHEYSTGKIESAIHAGIRLVLERAPTWPMQAAGYQVNGGYGQNSPDAAYRAMTAQLLKELE